jgi:rubrerythrin
MDAVRFKEIIDFAIEKEQEAIDAYTAASEMVKRSNVKEMLLDLAKQEEGHKRKLQSVEPGKVSAAHIEKVPDLKIADYTDNVEISAEMDYQDVLIVAMKREEKAHNLYSTLASNTTDDSLRRLFEVLAQEEAHHKLALEKEYDDHVLSWN